MELDKDRIIQEQEEEIEKLKRKIQILQMQNDTLEKEKKAQGSPLISTPWAQNLFDVLETTKKQYEELISELNLCKDKYKEQIDQVHALKDKYIFEMEKVQIENNKL